MNIVDNRKCKICGKAINIFESKDNEAGIGKVCSNEKECENRENSKSRK
jgi:hypothetical protein